MATASLNIEAEGCRKTVVDPVEVLLVHLPDHVEVRGRRQPPPQLELGAVNHPGHEVAVDGGGEEEQPGPEELEAVLLAAQRQGHVLAGQGEGGHLEVILLLHLPQSEQPDGLEGPE